MNWHTDSNGMRV